jgi:hypothetical protein
VYFRRLVGFVYILLLIEYSLEPFIGFARARYGSTHSFIILIYHLSPLSLFFQEYPEGFLLVPLRLDGQVVPVHCALPLNFS